jgi:hypothetical protein
MSKILIYIFVKPAIQLCYVAHYDTKQKAASLFWKAFRLSDQCNLVE